jgi:outer membrane protein TolC
MSSGRSPGNLRIFGAWRLIIPLVLSLASVGRGSGQEPAPAAPLDLPGFLQLARVQQPRLVVQRASLAAAEDSRRALETLHFPATLDPEIPVRRKQAALGVSAAAAGLAFAESETTYAITRNYYTVLYAREQESLARAVVERLEAVRKAAQSQLDAGAPDVSSSDVNRTLVYVRLAGARRTQATKGVVRALAALREAVGVPPDSLPGVMPARLTEPEAHPNRNDIVAAALAHRGDLIQATLFAEAVCLEVEAQSTSAHQRMQTFAAGSDIHARQVPQGTNNIEYRPGAVPPEMPGLLVGSRPERMKHAQDLHVRAEAAVDTIRNLIVLEAEDAFLRWEEAFEQVAQARDAAEAGDKLADDLTRDYTARLKVKVDEVVNARVLASQARSQYNEYVYREILALAELDRVTAWRFGAGLSEPAARPTQTAPDAIEKGK